MVRVLSMRYLILVFWRGTASVWELNICHRVCFRLRVVHQGVWGVCVSALQTVFQSQDFFGFVLNYDLLPNLQYLFMVL